MNECCFTLIKFGLYPVLFDMMHLELFAHGRVSLLGRQKLRRLNALEAARHCGARRILASLQIEHRRRLRVRGLGGLYALAEHPHWQRVKASSLIGVRLIWCSRRDRIAESGHGVGGHRKLRLMVVELLLWRLLLVWLLMWLLVVRTGVVFRRQNATRLLLELLKHVRVWVDADGRVVGIVEHCRYRG